MGTVKQLVEIAEAMQQGGNLSFSDQVAVVQAMQLARFADILEEFLQIVKEERAKA